MKVFTRYHPASDIDNYSQLGYWSYHCGAWTPSAQDSVKTGLRDVKYNDKNLQLFLKHRGALVDYATPLTGDRARAEDVVQDAFLRFMPQQSGAAAIGRPVGYLYRVVRNLAVDFTRRKKNEERVADEPAWWLLPSVPRTPEQDILHREDISAVKDALATLPEDARLAIEMSRFGGYTLQEIAKRLHISLPKAHRLVRDGLTEVAKALSEEGE